MTQIPQTWQPIATAPKDVVVIVFDRAFMVQPGVQFDFGWYSAVTKVQLNYVTHWMPLPVAPDGEGGEG